MPPAAPPLPKSYDRPCYGRSIVKRALVMLVAFTATARADAPAALRDVLGEAPTIVRGTANETTRAGAFSETRVFVIETLRGEIAGDTMTVRQPADGEEPLGRGEDFILLLDARTPDGAYPLHHPAGRYRVEPGEQGDVVVVNANGVDGAMISPKDLRPRAPDERIALATFRTFVGTPPKPPSVEPSPPVLSVPPRPARPVDPAPSTAMPSASSPERARRWPWFAAAFAAIGGIWYLARRRR
jgi:hypothetical protein